MTHSSGRGVDCIVIGAGVVGASVARELACSGMTAVVIDGAPGIGGGCSYANAAILAPHHVTPLATPALLREAPVQMMRRPAALRVRPDLELIPWMSRLAASARRTKLVGARLRALASDSTDLHVQLAREGLNPTLRKTGAIDVYLRHPRHELNGRLTPIQLRELEPALSGVVAGTHDRQEWTVESRSFVQSMLDDAARRGADVRFGTVARRLLVDNGRVIGVESEAGRILADHVVLAAGLQSAGLTADLGLNLPLRGGRGHVVDLAVPSEGAPQLPVRIKEHRVVVTPLADRIRVCGSIEFGRESRPVDPRRRDALREVANRVLPILRGQPVIDSWSGERPCTRDGLPLIGMSETIKNLAVATGHGMWGMILAPSTGQLIARALMDRQASADNDWLSPDRFTRPPVRT